MKNQIPQAGERLRDEIDASAQNITGDGAEPRTCHFCGQAFSDAVCPGCARNMRQAGAQLVPAAPARPAVAAHFHPTD